MFYTSRRLAATSKDGVRGGGKLWQPAAAGATCGDDRDVASDEVMMSTGRLLLALGRRRQVLGQNPVAGPRRSP